ncbi:MAG TPA: hypothetical protein HA367_08405 [Candidatus Methanofastidiosum sp.]|nr:hypothetical protein [Methanofastidiosum sp.]
MDEISFATIFGTCAGVLFLISLEHIASKKDRTRQDKMMEKYTSQIFASPQMTMTDIDKPMIIEVEK